MLNSFLQERFQMANLVKSANLELGKNSEYIRKLESDTEAYRGSLNKLRTNLSGGIEIDSIIKGIFLEIDSRGSSRI